MAEARYQDRPCRSRTSRQELPQDRRGARKKIWELAGQEFNVSSPKQLGDILFDKLALGGKI